MLSYCVYIGDLNSSSSEGGCTKHLWKYLEVLNLSFLQSCVYHMNIYNIYVRFNDSQHINYTTFKEGQHLVTRVISNQIKVLCEVYLWLKWLYRHSCKNYTPSMFGLRAGNNLVKEIQLKAPGSWGNRGDWYLLKSYFWEPQATGGLWGHCF